MLLAIETSCDECSAAVVQKENKLIKVHSNVVFSQIALHRRFGGVVPEVASRNHLEMFSPVVDEALSLAGIGFKELKAIAVTSHPGLIGALLVGVSAAKAMAYALKIPLIGVHHLEGHLHSLFIAEQEGLAPLSDVHLPLLVCLVSGGHTNLYLIRNLPPERLKPELIAQSRDDAAGEAFDKSAKLLGLDYPGGIHLDRLARNGDPNRFSFPRPLKNAKSEEKIEFSFSGLKTAVAVMLRKNGFEPHGSGLSWGKDPDPTKTPQGQILFDFCASIQEAIVDTLFSKIQLALTKTGAKGVAVVGGVSANSRLRERLARELSVPVFYPDLRYCTDNAAMIGACAAYMFDRGEGLNGERLLSLNATSS
jgi:N6-L-threonylcarbamoyladenine synthase